MKKATLHSDGGARGNPGPAGIGFVLVIPGTGKIFHSEYIGETTNNQAEYKALIAGLARALEHGVQEISCFLDSQLVVRQLKREYRVKNAGIKPLYEQARGLAEKFASITFEDVRREKNKEADALVNEAIDRAVK